MISKISIELQHLTVTYTDENDEKNGRKQMDDEGEEKEVDDAGVNKDLVQMCQNIKSKPNFCKQY
jgi:hypothetical protein